MSSLTTTESVTGQTLGQVGFDHFVPTKALAVVNDLDHFSIADEVVTTTNRTDIGSPLPRDIEAAIVVELCITGFGKNLTTTTQATRTFAPSFTTRTTAVSCAANTLEEKSQRRFRMVV